MRSETQVVRYDTIFVPSQITKVANFKSAEVISDRSDLPACKITCKHNYEAQP